MYSDRSDAHLVGDTPISLSCEGGVDGWSAGVRDPRARASPSATLLRASVKFGV